MATQTVTVLFTDLVGSTELSSRLGPERTEALRHTHFGLLRGAVAAAGGTEVKNLGDGLMVAFTSLNRALACAVAMQQTIDRHNRRADDPDLSVRIGIATGEATEEAGDYFGDPVVEAARLCAAAAGGQILTTEVVKLLAGRHATQEFIAVGELTLKGIPEPVAAMSVAWEPAADPADESTRPPLPARLVGASAESLFAFFGRTVELARLAETRKAAAADRQLRVTLISGEPGIGKTTLVAQAARADHELGTRVVYGGCEEGLAVPYQPWISALTQLVERADEDVLREFVDARGPATARLIPLLARRLSIPVPEAGNDADVERYSIFEGVAHLLASMSADAPVMLVLDDLHWVDAASLQLLRHLVTAAVPMAVHVVGTYRESDLSREHPLVGLLAHLRREPVVDRLDLVGLDDVEIIELLGAAAGHDLADDGIALGHALRRETAGNPFFLVEVIRHLAETGAFAQDDDGRWGLSADLDDVGLPSSVREVVANRVARLGEDTQRALSLAAVIGRDFDLDLLTTVLDGDEDRLLDILDGAIGAGLITVPDQRDDYRFVHALIQHTLYQDLSGPRRQRAHQRIAEAMEARAIGGSAPVEELARHWLAATRPHDATKALLYVRRAGDAAMGSYAPLDAARWYGDALELLARQGPEDRHLRCELLIDLGNAQRLAGLPEHRDTLRDAGRLALDLGDRDLLVGVARSRGAMGEGSAEVDPNRLAVLEAALDAVGSHDSAERAHLLACLTEETDPRHVDERVALATTAIDVAQRVGDERTLLTVLNLVVSAMATPDTLEQRRAASTLAIEVGERLDDRSALVQAHTNLGFCDVEAGDLAAFDRHLAAMHPLAAATRLPSDEILVAMLEAWRHLLAGRTEAAASESDRMLEIGTRIEFAVIGSTYGAQVLQRTAQQGGLADIVDLVVEAMENAPAIPTWRCAVMMLHCELGRTDAASELFEIGRSANFDDIPFDMAWLQGMSQYGEAAVELGRADLAPIIYDRLLPYAGRYIYLTCIDWGSVSRPLGRLATLMGRFDEAERHLGDALAVHERIPAPFWIARTQLDLVELCNARRGPDDAGRAQELLNAVADAIDRFGYHGLDARLERLSLQR
jgi:class 3 adenylate cyclase